MKRLTKGSKQLTLDEYKFSTSSDTSLTQPTQTVNGYAVKDVIKEGNFSIKVSIFVECATKQRN